jgi:hypothetical protein
MAAVPNSEKTSPPCDVEIFEKGESVCMFHAGSVVTEAWVKEVAVLSGQRVDWHYTGGMVNVLFIGDYEKVKSAVEELSPKLHASCEKATGHPAQLFRLFPRSSRGPYRRGDESPPGTLAHDSIMTALRTPKDPVK